MDLEDWLEYLRSKTDSREREYRSTLHKAKKDLRFRSKVRRVFEFVTRNLSYRSGQDPVQVKDILRQGYGDSKDIALFLAYSLSKAGVPSSDLHLEDIRLITEGDMKHTVVRLGELYLCPIYGIRRVYPEHNVLKRTAFN